MGKITAGSWKTVLMDIDRDVEFTGDDADKYSALIDLGQEYENVLVFVPTITSSTISLCLQRDKEISTVPIALHILDDDATGSFLSATTAAVTSCYILFNTGAIQFLRIYSATNQAADRTFYVRGC
jgi:hypothetical protein